MRQKGNYRLLLNANLFPEMNVQVRLALCSRSEVLHSGVRRGCTVLRAHVAPLHAWPLLLAPLTTSRTSAYAVQSTPQPCAPAQVMEGGRGVTFNCVNAALTDLLAPKQPPAADVSTGPAAAELTPASADSAKPSDAAAPSAGAAADASGAGAADAGAAGAAAAAPAERAEGAAEGQAESSRAAGSMVLHALRLRLAEQQAAFVRVVSDSKTPLEVQDAAGLWVPPV